MTEGNIVRCLIYALGHNYKGAQFALNCIAARGDGRQVTLTLGGQSPSDESCRAAIEHVLSDTCEGCGAYEGHTTGCELR